jgi:hypothetical protein
MNFPGFLATHLGRRWGFEGKEADEAIQRQYLEKLVPDNLKIGQRAFRYFDCLQT